MIYADDYYNLTEDMEKKRKFNEKVGDLFREDNLMLNDDKKKDKILRIFDDTKDSKNTNTLRDHQKARKSINRKES